jgi:hypothetical protein
MTKIQACGCKHAYQDGKYGRGMRVWNSCVKGWRCTVCSAVKSDR